MTGGGSCTKNYDAYGIRQTVAPTGAAIGAIILGALVYSIGKSQRDRHDRHHHNPPMYEKNHGWGYDDCFGDRYCR